MEEPTFETERIRELKNERIALQKKTFTKWMNTFLQDDAKVEDLFVDLSDGRLLIRLLESISEEKVGRIARGKQRIHKLENVSKALLFLRKSVKLESIGPEDVVDGKQDLILGLIWMIILRFQISKVENESGSKDAKSAKEALLIWCQRKTKGKTDIWQKARGKVLQGKNLVTLPCDTIAQDGAYLTTRYQGVDIKNFTTSWKNGLAFNALIHKHRPDLLEFSKLQPQQYRSNLNLAFTTAEDRLGVARLLDPEDFDSPKPDEKSVMTYVSMLYQHFAKMKSEETGGKRIAKILDVMIDIDKMKERYTGMVKRLLDWITSKIHWLDADVPKEHSLLQKSMNEFKALRTVEKPEKYIERANIEELFFIIQTKSNAYRLKNYRPPDGAGLPDINAAWQELEKGEHQREIRLREELARQQRLAQLAERFEKKAKLRDSWLDEMINVIQVEETSKSLQVKDLHISLKRHEAIETDVNARGVKVQTLQNICRELEAETYEGYQSFLERQSQINEKWQMLWQRLRKRKHFLVTLSEVNPLVSDVEKICSHLKETETNFANEEPKKDLYGIEDQLQKLVLQESQLNSFKSQIQSVVDSSSGLLRKNHSQSSLIRKRLQDMMGLFQAVSDLTYQKRKALEEARAFHAFKEIVKKESVFIQDKMQLAASREVGKDFVSFIRLQKKLQALEAEIEACEARCCVVCQNGQQLISEGNSSAEEIRQVTADLQSSVENLRKLAGIRADRLNEAAQSFQYYSDANEVESWISEHMQLVASEDYGKDPETTRSLLQRHLQIAEEITAFDEDMLTLQDECRQIEETDNGIGSTKAEASSKQREFDEIEVETETEDEEIIEKEVEQAVFKEFKVARVSAKSAYNGDGLAMKKGEVFYVAAKSSKDWWNVRRVTSKESGYVPAAYLKDIEPKVFKKQVMEKSVVQEKVKVKRKKLKKVLIERKTKEKLVDKRAKRTSSILRKKNVKRERKLRFTQHFDRENVSTRHLTIVVAYSKLKNAAEERRQKLDEALRYFEYCSAHDAVMTWVIDQIRYLARWTASNDVETINKLLERVEHEISANEDSYKDVLQKGQSILSKNNPCYVEDVRNRLSSMEDRYTELLNLKASRRNDLINSHGFDMFLKSCAELVSWISEKSNQLTDGQVVANQETIRALQRKHQNFEHELDAINDKLKQLRTDSKSIIQTHPSAAMEVDVKEKEVERCWAALKEKTRNRRLLLQEAYGVQGFLADYKDILHWAKDATKRYSHSDLPRDLTVLEEVIREHNESWLETKGNVQRLADVINSGEALNAKNNSQENITGLITELKMYEESVPKLWEQKEKNLSLCKSALVFCRDADSFVSRADVIQKLLSTNDNGASIENVTTLINQVKELSRKVYQQEERSKKINAAAEEIITANSHESVLIQAKRKDVHESHEMTKELLHHREEALKQSKEFQQFRADIEEFLSWIDDKLALVNEETYKDLASLQNKVLKHQALQAETISNQVTKSRLIQTGEDMLCEKHFSSEKVNDLLSALNEKWNQLEEGVKSKQEKLEQATKGRAFSNAFDDFELWCDQIQSLLSSQELGDDLSSVKFLRAKHQVSENDVIQHQKDLDKLEQEAMQMVQDGNFRSDAVMISLNEMKRRLAEISEAARTRSSALEGSFLLQQFLFEVNIQSSWIDEHEAQIRNADTGTNLTTAKRHLKRHEAVQNELNNHSTVISKLIENGFELVKSRPFHAEVAKDASGKLKDRFNALQQASNARKAILQHDCDAFQFLVDVNEMENWLDEKTALVSGLQHTKDLDTTERQLKKTKVLIDDLKHSKENIETFKKRAQELHRKNNPRKDEVLQKCKLIIQKDQRLTVQLQKIHTNLENLHMVYQFFHDAENLRDWVSGKLKVASSDGYGKDHEHWQVISQKFDDFKVSIAAGKTSYEAVINLAEVIVSSNGPHSSSVANAKDKLSAMWNRLMDKVKQKNSRLQKAGELHKFNLQVNDIVSNLKEKGNKMSSHDLGDDVISTESKVRSHDTTLNELEAASKQIEGLGKSAKKLVSSYPGKTAEQIQMHQAYVKKLYADILRKAKNIKGKLHGSVDYHRLNSEIVKLLSWCKETLDAIDSGEQLESVDEIEEAMDRLDDMKLEIDGKEEKFGFIVDAGEQMVDEGHHATEEIQERLEELITCREDLNNTWIQRKQHLTESYDFQMFCREMSRIKCAVSSNKSFLKSISGGKSSEEIELISKRVQKVKNMFESQTSKLEAALDLGSQLIDDGHFGSERVRASIEDVILERTSLKEEISKREEFLKDALALAEFRMENEEIQSWINEKLSNVRGRQIEVSSIGVYSTIHKSDLVELKARGSAKESLRNKGEILVEAGHFASGEVEDSILKTFRLFEQLENEIKDIGKEIEMVKSIAELKRDVDFAEAHITEKERPLATDETGEDYDQCQTLRKHLENITKHMKADEERIKAINEKAKLIKGFKSDLVEELAIHLRLLNSRWENVKGLATSRRLMLDRFARVLLIRKNTDEVKMRINEKISLLAKTHVAGELNNVQKQIRRHALLESDVEAIEASLEELDLDARDVVKESPENLKEVQIMQTEIIEVWETLVELMDERQSNLQSAEHLYRFQTDVSSLSSWVGKAREKLASIEESRNVKETKAMLNMHHQIKSELKIRREVFDRVKQYGETLVKEGGLRPDEVYPKLQQLDEEKTNLEKLLQEKNISLTHSFDMQRFGSELEQMQSWLERRNDILLKDDYGNSLDEAERLLSQHDDMKNAVDKFLANLSSLSTSAKRITSNESQNSLKTKEKYEDVSNRLKSAKTLVDDKLKKLRESQLFFDFLKQKDQMTSWINEKLNYAKSEIEKSANLQNCKKVCDDVEAEMSANKKNVNEAISNAQTLIDRSIRAESVSHHMKALSGSWQELEAAFERKKDEIEKRLALDMIESAFEDVNKWLNRIELSLNNDNFGKDLDSVVLLQSKHKELVNEIADKENVIKNLERLICEDVQVNERQADEIRDQYDDIHDRFKDLVMQSETRGLNLEFSLEFHSLCQEVEDEKVWINEKQVYLKSQEFGADLTGAKHVFKRHQMMEAEIASHENMVISLVSKLHRVSNDSFYKEEAADAASRLNRDWGHLKTFASEKNKKIREFVYHLKLVADTNQAILWVRDHLPVLQSKDFGKDESTTSTLLRKNIAMQNDIKAFHKTIQELEGRVNIMIQGQYCGDSQRNATADLQASLKTEYESVVQLGVLRNKKLDEKMQMHRFHRLTNSIASWMDEKISLVDSTEVGQKLKETEEILKNFQDFISELKANEKTLTSIKDMVMQLEEAGHSDIELIRGRFGEVQNAFFSLKQASFDRLQKVSNAKRVQVFRLALDELSEWVERKRNEAVTVDMKNGLHLLVDQHKKHDAFILDLNALTSKADLMRQSFRELCEEVPDALESLQQLVDQIDKDVDILAKNASLISTDLAKAEDLKSFCHATENLKTWIKDRISIVKRNGQNLLSKSVDHENAYITYRDHLTERDARKSKIDYLSKDATRLAESVTDLKSVINEEIQTLLKDWQNLDDELHRFQEDLDDTKDSETLKDDLVNLEKWMEANSDAFQDTESSSLDDIDELLRQQDDFEKSIAVQEGRFQSTLGRLSKYTEKVESKYSKKANHGSADYDFDQAKELEKISNSDKDAISYMHNQSSSEEDSKRRDDGCKINEGRASLQSEENKDNRATAVKMEAEKSANQSKNNNYHELKRLKGNPSQFDNSKKAPEKDKEKSILKAASKADSLRIEKKAASRSNREASAKEKHSEDNGTGMIDHDIKSRQSSMENQGIGENFRPEQINDALKSVQNDGDVNRTILIANADIPSPVLTDEESDSDGSIIGSYFSSTKDRAFDHDRMQAIGVGNRDEYYLQGKPPGFDHPGGSHDYTIIDSCPPETTANDVMDEDIVPAQVQLTESSMDFSCFGNDYYIDDNDDDAEEKNDDNDDDHDDDDNDENVDDYGNDYNYGNDDDNGDNNIDNHDDNVDDHNDEDDISKDSEEGRFSMAPTSKTDFYFEEEVEEQEEVNNNGIPACEEDHFDEDNFNEDQRFYEESLHGDLAKQRDAFGHLGDHMKSEEDEAVKGIASYVSNESEASDELVHNEDSDLGFSKMDAEFDEDAEVDNQDIEFDFSSDEALDTQENSMDYLIRSFEAADDSEKKYGDKRRPGLNEDLRIENASSEKANQATGNDEIAIKGNAVEESPIPAILVSRPSYTEDGIKEQFSQEKLRFASLDFAGILNFKEEVAAGGRKSSARKWKEFYVVISGKQLVLFASEEAFRKRVPPKKEINLKDAQFAVQPRNFSNVLALDTADEAEFLVKSEDEDVFDDFLMAISEASDMTCKEDTVSLPPAPPPPEMPRKVAEKEPVTAPSHFNPAQEMRSTSVQLPAIDVKKSSIPAPQFSSDESDEFDDVLPPPALVMSLPSLASPSERKMSLGLLDLVGRSTALADSSSDEEDEEWKSSSSFNADILEEQEESVNDEKPPRKLSKMNKLFSKAEPSFADETTPITLFGTAGMHSEMLDELTTGDLSENLGPRRKPQGVTNDHAKSGVTPRSNPRPANLNLPSLNARSVNEAMDKSPSSPGKEGKRKGFLGGIFRKKKQ